MFFKKSSYVNSYDVETIEIEGRVVPICVSFVINNNVFSVYSLNCIEESFVSIESLCKRSMTYVFYTHNINFDGLLVIEAISKKPYKFNILAVRSNIYNIRIYMASICIELRCSFKLMPSSLADLSKNLLNIEKLPYPYQILNENFNDTDKISKYISDEYEDRLKELGYWDMSVKEYTIKYCENDAIITKKLVEKFWDTLKLFKMKRNDNYFSSPSISVNIFFKKYNVYKIQKVIPKWVDKLIRRGYYGGRCEVFGNPYDDEQVFHFDFSGMYGLCMKSEFPIGDPLIDYNAVDVLKPGFYSVDWETDSELPVLPMKDESTGKLMFYTGRGCGIYWYEELILFTSIGGRVLKINWGLVYQEKANVFKNFVEDMWKIRDMGGMYKTLGKLLINSTYGRLGMGRDNTTTRVYIAESPPENVVSYYKINNVIIAELSSDKEFSGISNVLMAAIITSKARVKLYKAFIDVIRNGGRLLYCDTDSIVAAYKRDVGGETHGEVFWDKNKKDTKIVKSCFALPKTYSVVFEDKTWVTKIKGFKRNHIDFENFRSVFTYDGNIYDENFISIEKKEYKLRVVKSNKSVKIDSYSKRIWKKDKYESLPFKR